MKAIFESALGNELQPTRLQIHNAAGSGVENETSKASPTSWIAKAAGGALAAAAFVLLFLRAGIWASGCLLGLFVSTMAVGQQASLAAARSPSDPQATILQTAETYRHAVLDGDAAAVTALFREDAVEMPPFQQAVAGRSAIAQFYEGAFHGPVKVTAFTFSHTETSVHGDVGIDVGTYKRSMTTPGGPIEAAGPYVVVLKQTEGKWRIAYLIYNSDCPPGGKATGAQASR